MKAIQFILLTVNGMHQAMVNDVKTLTPAQLVWKPAPGANPIGFLFWHTARVEDMAVSGWQKKTPVWEEDKWYEKLGLDAKVYGGGFQEPDVDKVARLPADIITAYVEKVFRNTGIYIQSLDEDKLDFAPNSERPNITIGLMLGNYIIGHGWWHLGEIRYIKGMQGMTAGR
ncbi:MAG: DinB family protein [Dehalococcoidales bacterium]|nr:DinB family protein [Dehalococcoidales bacterium]